jgi:uracil-DNA glycosylase
MDRLPPSWEFIFDDDTVDYVKKFEERYRGLSAVPRPCLVFRFLYELRFRDVKVVIVGQNPYREERQACGYAFSVERGVEVPPSLGCVYREIKREIPSFAIPDHGDLEKWVRNGVLLVNASLTLDVGDHSRISHFTFWYPIVSKIIKSLSDRGGVIFLLWGKKSRRFSRFVNRTRNHVLEAPHPSPRAGEGFVGCGHFSLVCDILCDPDFWNLPF